MSVYVHFGGDASMSKPLRNQLSMHPLVNEQRCRCMSQIMEADIPETILFYELPKPKIRPFVVKGSTVRMGEYKEVFATLSCVTNLIPLLNPVCVIIPQFFIWSFLS